MTDVNALGIRLRSIGDDLRAKGGMCSTPVDLDVGEIDALIEALLRPAVRHSCASTTNYPDMAERALRLIERNGIHHPDAIDGVTHLVDCAGLDHAQKSLEDDDAIPF